MSRCRNFRALSINPWIFCLITFHGFYSLEPFGSIILRFIIFLLGHAGAVECPCKLLSCRSKQICLIVKTLTNNPQWSRDRYGRPTTWPNIFQCRNTTAGVRHSQIYEECLGVLSHCLALAYNYARTWKTNKTIFRIAVWFRQQDGQHFVNLWPNILRSKKMRRRSENMGNKFWMEFCLKRLYLYIWFAASGKALICIFIKCKYFSFYPDLVSRDCIYYVDIYINI